MKTLQEENNWLHVLCISFEALSQAFERERDLLKKEVERLTDELYLAHEALRREMP